MLANLFPNNLMVFSKKGLDSTVIYVIIMVYDYALSYQTVTKSVVSNYEVIRSMK